MGKSSLMPPIQTTLTLYQDETIEYYSGYSEEEIDPVCQLMVDYLARPIVHEAFVKKYAGKKFLKGKHLPYPCRLTLLLT